MSSSVRSTRNSRKAELKNAEGFKKRRKQVNNTKWFRGYTVAILYMLSRYGELSLHEFSELLNIDKKTVNVYLWRMQKYGLIVISSYENYYYYSLTERGRALLEEKKQLLEKSISSINSMNDCVENADDVGVVERGIRSIRSITMYNTYNTYNTYNKYNTYNTYNTYNKYNSLYNNTSHTLFDIKHAVDYIKNHYKISDTASVVVEVLIQNYLRSGCRRKYMKFTEPYQLIEEFKLKHDELRDALRELENKGIIYVYANKSSAKIGLLNGFVDELVRTGLRC